MDQEAHTACNERNFQQPAPRTGGGPRRPPFFTTGPYRPKFSTAGPPHGRRTSPVSLFTTGLRKAEIFNSWPLRMSGGPRRPLFFIIGLEKAKFQLLTPYMIERLSRFFFFQLLIFCVLTKPRQHILINQLAEQATIFQHIGVFFLVISIPEDIFTYFFPL